MIEVIASAKLQDSFNLTDKELKKAIAKATRKTFKTSEKRMAKEISKAADIPYEAARKRTKGKYTLRGDGQFFFGLNPIAVKYISATRRASEVNTAGNKGFMVKKLGEHWFSRRGKKRLPIDRINVPIEDDASPTVTEKFPEEVQALLIENLFLEIDKIKGYEKGTSQTAFK